MPDLKDIARRLEADLHVSDSGYAADVEEDMYLLVVDGDIVWTCPATGARRARFGELARGRG